MSRCLMDGFVFEEVILEGLDRYTRTVSISKHHHLHLTLQSFTPSPSLSIYHHPSRKLNNKPKTLETPKLPRHDKTLGPSVRDCHPSG